MNLNQLSHKWSSKIILIIDKITIEEDFKAVDTDEDGKVTLEEGMKVYELRIPSEGFWEFRLLCLWLLLKFQMLKIVLNSDMALNNSVESVIQS